MGKKKEIKPIKKEIFERLDNETQKAWQAFVVYRDLGYERSIANAAKVLGKSPRTVEHWCLKYNWVERAKAYDEYLENKKREEKEKAILEMVERHAKMAMAFQQRIAERLNALDPEELSPADLAKWLDISTKLERISRGEPTEIGKNEINLPSVVEVVVSGEDAEEES